MQLGFPEPIMPKEIEDWPEDLSMVDGPYLSKLLTQYTALRGRAAWLATLVNNDHDAYSTKAKSLESERLANLDHQGGSVTEKKARASANPLVRSLKTDAEHARFIYDELRTRMEDFEWRIKAVSREIARRSTDIEE